MKFYKKSSIAKNLLVFIFSSVFYWHILISIEQGHSAFNIHRFTWLLFNNLPLIALMAITAFSVLKVKNWSTYLFVAFTVWIFYQSVSLFFVSFNKLTLLLTFIYLICSFYFYLFWQLELKGAAYCPGYSPNDMRQSEYDLKVQIEIDKGGRKFRGYLTNWDVSSCFVALEDELESKSSQINLLMEFENKIFYQKGEIVAHYGHGIGIKFLRNKIEKNKKEEHNWLDLYTIIDDRGYLPQNLRIL